LKRTLPPTYFLIAGLVMLALHLIVPLAMLVPWPWSLAGILPILAGGALAIVADRRFKQARTTVKPFERSSMLVTEGPFRYSRNPMYLGMLAMLAGLWLLLGTLGPLVALPAFFWLIRQRFVLPEEQAMAVWGRLSGIPEQGAALALTTVWRNP
jgi:protein-S-isoprenylcysteine O-methyltransferase Ste14